jgi:hypothetical protein
MGSKALANLDKRLEDIDRLLRAHDLLTRRRRAEVLQKKTKSPDLTLLAKIMEALVTPPGPGRAGPEVEVLNRAGIVLLCAHLQGYVEELFAEAAEALLGSTVEDVEALVEEATDRFSNPHAYRIDGLFASIGLSRVTKAIAWPRSNNETTRKNLTGYVELRNGIAHGKQITVRKSKVQHFKAFVDHFSERLDVRVGERIRDLTGEAPW